MLLQSASFASRLQSQQNLFHSLGGPCGSKRRVTHPRMSTHVHPAPLRPCPPHNGAVNVFVFSRLLRQLRPSPPSTTNATTAASCAPAAICTLLFHAYSAACSDNEIPLALRWWSFLPERDSRCFEATFSTSSALLVPETHADCKPLTCPLRPIPVPNRGPRS